MLFETKPSLKSIIIFSIYVLVMITISVTMVVVVAKKINSKDDVIVINDLQTTFTESWNTPTGSSVLTEVEYNSISDEVVFGTYDTYLAQVSPSFTSTNNITATGANADLFNFCDNYFRVYYGYSRISPIFPMALANVETPGRMDQDITWSSLFPSKYVDATLMDSFDVTYVISDDEIFAALSSEYSTRDRGALQMSPTYGTDNKAINNLMSGTEKDKLRAVDSSKHSTWASGASSYSGDRFYLPDVLLRLQVAMQDNVYNITTKGYTPSTDMQLIAMLSVAHNTGSGIWFYSNHQKKVGNWISGEKAFELCENLGSTEFIEVLQNYAHSSERTYITTEEALNLYSKVFSDSITNYTTNTTNGTFPIKSLYAYIKLSELYTE